MGVGAFGLSLLLGIVMWLVQRTGKEGDGKWLGKVQSTLEDLRAMSANIHRMTSIMHEWMSPNSEGIQAWRSPEVLHLLKLIADNQKILIDDHKVLIEEIRGLRRSLEKP